MKKKKVFHLIKQMKKKYVECWTKYTTAELKDEVYYFFRGNVFGLGRTITTVKEKKCTLTDHDNEEEFEFTLKNKDGSSSCEKRENNDKSKEELVRMYAFIIRNINKDSNKP